MIYKNKVIIHLVKRYHSGLFISLSFIYGLVSVLNDVNERAII